MKKIPIKDLKVISGHTEIVPTMTYLSFKLLKAAYIIFLWILNKQSN